MTAWLPVFNTTYHGTTTRVAGTFTASYSILASLSRSATGKTADKIGGGKSTLIGVTLLIMGSVLMGFSQPYSPYHFCQFGGLFLMAFGGGFTNAAVYKWIPKVAPTGKAPTGGLVGGLGAFGGFVIPAILGIAANMHDRGYAYGLFVYAFIGIFCFIFSLILVLWLEKNPPLFSALNVTKPAKG